MEVNLNRLCSKCYQFLDKNENAYVFKLVDDFQLERTFNGHKKCMDELYETIQEAVKKESLK